MPALLPCLRALVCYAVANATEVTVTCAKPEAGYVAGTYTLTVSAQAGVQGCSDTGSDTATLTVNAKPTIVITGPTAGQVGGHLTQLPRLANFERAANALLQLSSTHAACSVQLSGGKACTCCRELLHKPSPESLSHTRCPSLLVLFLCPPTGV
jgi:hypothetical protein